MLNIGDIVFDKQAGCNVQILEKYLYGAMNLIRYLIQLQVKYIRHTKTS